MAVSGRIGYENSGACRSAAICCRLIQSVVHIGGWSTAVLDVGDRLHAPMWAIWSLACRVIEEAERLDGEALPCGVAGRLIRCVISRYQSWDGGPSRLDMPETMSLVGIGRKRPIGSEVEVPLDRQA